MEDRMLLWKEYIEENINNPIDVDLDLIRVSIISVKGKSISEYFTFKDKLSLVEFLKEVVLPSITLSIFFEDSKDPSLYLWNKAEIVDFLEVNAGVLHRNILINYKEAYNYIEKIECINIKAILDLVSYLEKKFDVYNMVFLNLSYGETADNYLENLLELYEGKNLLEILDKDLQGVNLSIDKLKDVMKNIYEYERDIRENILDKIPSGN